MKSLAGETQYSRFSDRYQGWLLAKKFLLLANCLATQESIKEIASSRITISAILLLLSRLLTEKLPSPAKCS